MRWGGVQDALLFVAGAWLCACRIGGRGQQVPPSCCCCICHAVVATVRTLPRCTRPQLPALLQHMPTPAVVHRGYDTVHARPPMQLRLQVPAPAAASGRLLQQRSAPGCTAPQHADAPIPPHPLNNAHHYRSHARHPMQQQARAPVAAAARRRLGRCQTPGLRACPLPAAATPAAVGARSPRRSRGEARRSGDA